MMLKLKKLSLIHIIESMNILIDGYNLLYRIEGKEVSERRRAQFAQLAQNYAQRKNHTLYIVYDAGPYVRFTQEKRGSVVTIYSGHTDSADDVIKQYIEGRILSDLLLITSDRELLTCANTYNIPCLDPAAFYDFMRAQPAHLAGYKKVSGQVYAYNDQRSSELDELMLEGSSVLSYKEESTQEENLVGSSKHEKRMLALLKKL